MKNQSVQKVRKKYEIKYDSRHIGHVVEKNQLV